MPTVTTKLESTKQDILNGRKTGSPVSMTEFPVSASIGSYQDHVSLTGMQRRIDNLLGPPELRCHLFGLASLV